MATIDDKDFIDNIIKNNGYYNGDDDNSLGDNPRIIQIIEYTNAWGNRTWAILTLQDVISDRYRASQYVRNPKTIWTYQTGEIKE